MAQRMITIERVRSYEIRLKEGKKVQFTLEKLLKLEDLVPAVLRHTNLEPTVSRFLLKPKYRSTAYLLLKKIRSKKETSVTPNVSTPIEILQSADTSALLLPPPPAPPSPVDLILSTKDHKKVMTAMKEWLQGEETENQARELMGRLHEICPDGRLPRLI